MLHEPEAAPDAEVWRDAGPETAQSSPEPSGPAPDIEPLEPVAIRPLAATFLASTSTALVIGGIFNSWPARLLGLLAAGLGTAGVYVTLRTRRQALVQTFLFPAVLLLSTLTLVGAPGGPSELPRLVREAIDAGRLLSAPFPFDPGWRPVVFALVFLIAYAAAWLATSLERPLVGVLVPMAFVGLAAITQPKSGQALTAVFVFVPLLGALGVLFAAAGSASQQLDLRFELRRALKALLAGIPAVILIFLLSSAAFLFPEPAYDPNDQPQKPKAVPLSATADRVLFSVKAPDGFTGPWRTGVLDIYDTDGFKLPGASARRARDIPAGGVIDASKVASASVEVTITTGDLGNATVLPSVPTAAVVDLPATAPHVRLDPRTGALRLDSGRVPRGLTYNVRLPAYPTADALKAIPDGKPRGGDFSEQLVAPEKLPVALRRIMREAPANGFTRLDYVRHQLLDHITAAGAGTPAAMDAARVQDMFEGSKKGSPFDIVAAQVLLARWLGYPARIGFGFNGPATPNASGLLEVHPKDAAQWLEVWFNDYGWVPLLDVPPKADTALDNEDDPQVLASDDVAVDAYIPVSLPRPVAAYEVVRARLYQTAPLLLLVLVLRLAAPGGAKLVRRRRRAAWGRELGPRGVVAAAYAEWRDTATDLNLGDPFATPIEFLAAIDEDHDHAELAWLVSRVMYGDLGETVAAGEGEKAEELSESLRRRLRQGQPAQVRAAAMLSQASLRAPYSIEMPNVTLPQPGVAARRRIEVTRPRFAAARRRRRLARLAAPAVGFRRRRVTGEP